MKRTSSLLSNLFLTSILLGSPPMVGAAELVVREAASLSLDCHTKFPDIRADDLSLDWRVLDEATGYDTDSYGPCDHDLNGADEIKIQRQITPENYHPGR